MWSSSIVAIHFKNPIQFQFCHCRMVAMGNMYVYLKYSKIICITNKGDNYNKKIVIPILLLGVVVVVVEFKSLYLKNCK